jgi:hypothetical protein
MLEAFPPLLPDGLHVSTLDDLHTLCVTAFPLSAKRVTLMDGLRRMVSRLEADGIEGDLLTDGSFLTQKIDPRDVDIALEVSERFLLGASTAQRDTLNWLGSDRPDVRSEIQRDYGCHSFVFCAVPPGHPWHPGFDIKAYWLEQFGRDRRNNPKGIAVLSIGGGVR